MHDFYIAAPLFTQAEKSYNLAIYNVLKRWYGVFLPQLSVLVKPDEIFQYNLDNLRQSMAIIVVCDGADMDSGTAWEAGHFYGHGPIYALRTDFRKSSDDQENGFNLMISQSADHIFTERDIMLDWIIKYVEGINE